MSISIEVAVECDGLPQWGCPARIHHKNGAMARREARALGWRTGLPGGKDFCPDHTHLIAIPPGTGGTR